jgi:tagatose 1,6-diphosphate aldolase
MHGKRWGLRRLADNEGHFKMLAIDQRPPIAALIARARGIADRDVRIEDMLAVKRALAAVLAAQASAVLVDPNYGYPACADLLRPDRGLVLTLEDHRFEETPRGRKSRTIDNWSVAKIKRLGADAVKVLAWYRPDAEPSVLEHQQRFVAGIGEACREHDIAFVLELLTYPFAGEATHSTAYAEAAGKRADQVIESVRRFGAPEFGVDLFKLESPLSAETIARRDAAEKQRAQSLFRDLSAATGSRPWVMLSGGASKGAFAAVLELAYAAGASGYLAGRAIWWEALQSFPDLAACVRQLEDSGVAYLRELNALTDARAAPAALNAPLSAPRREGEFAAGYAPASVT